MRGFWGLQCRMESNHLFEVWTANQLKLVSRRVLLSGSFFLYFFLFFFLKSESTGRFGLCFSSGSFKWDKCGRGPLILLF